ncbi:chitin binding peritrophin-A domain-containing protein [Streptomyces sp. NPDC093589]|uniref:chitin binding peritrophin-A domain-containing protein n=1 Tax=Streptomyces sp. NPDC093589 TaxID=3366043 RepID=UPI00381F4F39
MERLGHLRRWSTGKPTGRWPNLNKVTTIATLTLRLALVPAAGALADEATPGDWCSTDKLMPYPGHADTFIQCSNGVPYVMPCPDGLVLQL